MQEVLQQHSTHTHPHTHMLCVHNLAPTHTCFACTTSHTQVQEVLLRIVDDGSLSDSQGRRASFESAFVVFTLSHHHPNSPAHRQQAAAPLSSLEPQHACHEQQRLQHRQQEGPQGGNVVEQEEGAGAPSYRGAGHLALQMQQEADNAGELEEAAAPTAQSSQVAALASSSSGSGGRNVGSAGAGASDSGGKGSSGPGTRGSSTPSRLPPAVQQLLGLVDATIDFAPLGRAQLARVVEAQLAEAAATLAAPAGDLVGLSCCAALLVGGRAAAACGEIPHLLSLLCCLLVLGRGSRVRHGSIACNMGPRAMVEVYAHWARLAAAAVDPSGSVFSAACGITRKCGCIEACAPWGFLGVSSLVEPLGPVSSHVCEYMCVCACACACVLRQHLAALQPYRACCKLQGGATGVALEVDEAARQFLVDAAESRAVGGPGAQHVRGLIRTHVLGPLAEQLLQQRAQGGAEGGRAVEPEAAALPVVRVSYNAGAGTHASRETGRGGGAGTGEAEHRPGPCLEFNLFEPDHKP